MKTLLAIAIIVLSHSLVCGAELPRSSPEAQGVSAWGVLAFVEAADKEIDSLHSFMLLRHGHVVAEGWWSPYCAEAPHRLYSLSKSFTSTAVGLAIAEGKLSLDDEVLKFFAEALRVSRARIAGVEQRIVCGRGDWQKQQVAWGSLAEQPAAASGAWTADDSFTAKLCFYETPFTITVNVTFSGDELHCNSEANVAFGPTKESPLVGKAQ